ncbi:hypothetical protein [Prosthecobacter dejongeii]|uniref:Competence protein ComGF n=1 Tax=Prosthecobacter dejongeii TaxID=48465 RepID=A0A7W7YLP8_9BACT|nr:hypothetical protein [Prosthecobacter dejongeii]MBB5038354.1 competence protein ComGF [Prosthecobacter dejongeii]
MMTPPLQNLTVSLQKSSMGFSLVECILSVAITVTSLLTVIGMLMGTLGVASDSKQETTTGVLIRQLAGEIKDMTPPAKPEDEPEPLIVLVDETMKILEHSRFNNSNVKESYNTGSQLASAASFARIDRVPDPENTLMDRIVIRVESPASAPAENRQVRKYAALCPK